MAVGQGGFAVLGGVREGGGGDALFWKEDGEDGAGPGACGVGADAEGSSVFFYEFAGDPETESGAGIFFGGEEGLEDAADVVLMNAAAGVGDGDADAAAGGIAGIGGGVCRDADGGATGAGVEAIGDEVGEDLTNLAGDAENLLLRIGGDGEEDPEGEGAGGVEVGDFADDGGWFEVRRGGGFAVEAERLPGDVGDAAEFGFGLAEEPADFIHFVGVAGDVDEVGEAFEGIVDLVRDRRRHASGGGELFGAHEGSLGETAVGDVAEDEDDADHAAFAVADGGSAVVDADLLAVFGDEEGVVGEADDGAEATYFVDGIFDGGAGLLVEDGKDIMEGDALGFALGPAGELLGDEVHEGYVAIGVAGDDCVADAANGGVEPLLAGIGLVGAEFDFPDLGVVEGGELLEEPSRLPGDEGRGGEGEGDESEEGDTACSTRGEGAADAERLFGVEEVVCLGSEVIHALLAEEHVGF